MNTLLPPARNKGRDQGFTLVELLVVIAMVALLSVLLIPTLAGTKPNAQSFQCLQNQRQVILAWQMYAEDDSDLLAPNDYPFATAYATASASTKAEMKNWVVGTMEQPSDSSDQPFRLGRLSELLDPNTVLSTYLNSRAVFYCPADNYIDPATQRQHVRSYSMNSAVGTIFYSHYNGNSATPVGAAVGGGWLPGSYYNASQTAWLTYGKMSSFSKPGPANTWVVMDENPYSINDGDMAIPAFAAPGSTYLTDFPSGNHNGAAGIAFADGHSIIHKWQDAYTYSAQNYYAMPGRGSSMSVHWNPDNPDCFYLSTITSAPR